MNGINTGSERYDRVKGRSPLVLVLRPLFRRQGPWCGVREAADGDNYRDMLMTLAARGEGLHSRGKDACHPVLRAMPCASATPIG